MLEHNGSAWERTLLTSWQVGKEKEKEEETHAQCSDKAHTASDSLFTSGPHFERLHPSQ